MFQRAHRQPFDKLLDCPHAKNSSSDREPSGALPELVVLGLHRCTTCTLRMPPIPVLGLGIDHHVPALRRPQCSQPVNFEFKVFTPLHGARHIHYTG